MALDDAAMLLDCAPQHVSLYMLTIEEGTPLASRACMTEALEQQQLEQYLAVRRLLLDRGYVQYEISAFSRPGFESRHNIKYWTWQPYMGFGPSAHSFIDGQRYANIRDLSAYCDDPLSSLSPERVDEAGRIAEFILSGMRYLPGLSLERFAREFGDSARNRLVQQAQVLQRRGLVELDGSFAVRLTENGLMLADSVIEFLVAAFLR
jgi:oxygen-independent coproporphyrinogen-3 oxidase